MATPSPAWAPELQQLVLDADPIQSVSQIAHRLGVAEVGLPTQRSGLVPRTRHSSFSRPMVNSSAPVTGAGRITIRGGDGGGADARRFPDDLGHGENQPLQPGSGLGGDLEHLQAAGLQLRLRDLGQLATVRDVDLVQGDQPRPILQPAVGSQLGLDHVQIGDRVPTRLEGGAVEHVHDRGAAFDVAQEVVPETATLGGAFDQAGHVGDGVGGLPSHHDAQIRHQGGEGVVGDLRPGP